jgi:multiple sugar transport system permease protein
MRGGETEPMTAERRVASGRLAGIMFVVPSLALVAVFFLAPLGLTAWMSFNDWPLFGSSHYIGLQNYRRLAQDPSARDAFLFTVKYTVLVTVAIFAVASGLTFLVQRNTRGVGLLRTAFFVPVVIGFAASSLLWGWLYNAEVGAIPAFLDWAGITNGPIDVFAGSTSALIAVIVMVTWKTAGFTMVLLLVGFQSIPQEVLDAADVDGSRRWQTLRYVTLPLMRRTIVLALILSVTGSFLAFDQFYIMTHGGPGNSTITIVYEIVRSAFVFFQLGYAGALALVLLAVLVVLNAMQVWLLRERSQA